MTNTVPLPPRRYGPARVEGEVSAPGSARTRAATPTPAARQAGALVVGSRRARPTRAAPESSTRLRRLAHPVIRSRPLGAAYVARLMGGIGHVAVGMHRQGYDLQLTQYDERGWRATFYTTGMEHSPTSATGTGWERASWHATQRAAWEALKQVET